MIIADTGAVIALINADDRHHANLRSLCETDPDPWVLPWAILPEVYYLVSCGDKGAGSVLGRSRDGSLPGGAWGDDDQLKRAQRLCGRYSSLRLGLLDAIVITLAESLRADAIATPDSRHFAAVAIRGGPKLYPRDLS